MWLLTVASLTNEAPGELGVGQPGGEQPQHLELAPGERGQCAAAACPRGERVAAKRSSSRRVTDGASRASPAATTRIASTSWAGWTSLSRNPLAPARIAVVHVLVEVERRQDDDPAPVTRRRPPARRLHAVDVRHAHVHQDDVRDRAAAPARSPRRRRRPPRRPRCRGRASRIMRKPRGRAPGRRRRGPGSSRPRSSSGNRARTRTRRPGRGPRTARHRTSATRSRIPIRPVAVAPT